MNHFPFECDSLARGRDLICITYRDRNIIWPFHFKNEGVCGCGKQPLTWLPANPSSWCSHFYVTPSPRIWAGPNDLLLMNRKRQKWWAFASVWVASIHSLVHSLAYCRAWDALWRGPCGKDMREPSANNSWETVRSLTPCWDLHPASHHINQLASWGDRSLEWCSEPQHPATLIQGNCEIMNIILSHQWTNWKYEYLLMNLSHGGIQFGSFDSTYLTHYIKGL